MGAITLPNFRTTADVTMNTKLKDGGVYIDWTGLTEIKAWLYSDAQRAIAGRCDVSIDAGDSTKLVCLYSATKPQYPGVQRLIVQAKYLGRTKTYDKPVFNFVTRTAAQAGTPIVIDDPTVDVEIVVEDVSSSILDAAIEAALQAAADAEHAAHLIPNQVLLDCEAATAAALDAAGKAPYINEDNLHWMVWDPEEGQYVDSGKMSKGDTGNGIASWSVAESAEDGGSNVVTVTFTNGAVETFTYKNGHTGNGIASIVQTVESPDDAGTNVITITMTNGTVVTFNVKNGSKGQPGAAQAAYKSVNTLPTASAATMDKIYLTPSGTSGVYNMSYTDYDGSAYSWVSLGTTAIQLSDYATKAEVTQLEHEVNGYTTQDIDVTPTTDTGYYFGNSGTSIVIYSNAGSKHSGTVVNTSTPPSDGIDVSGYIGKTIRVTLAAKAVGSSRQTLIADSNMTYLVGYTEDSFEQDEGETTYSKEFVVPANAKWLFWSAKENLVSIIVKGGERVIGLMDRLEALEGQLDADNPDMVSAVAELDGGTIAQTSELADRYIKYSDGTLGVSSNFNIRFINVRNARKVYVKTKGTDAYSAIAFYGEAGLTDLITPYALTNGEIDFCIDVPANAYMLGVSFVKEFTPTILVTQGSKTPVVRATDVMEMGDISIGSTGYLYRYYSTRARTIYKTTLHLNPGDKVFTDGTVVLFYAANTVDGYIYGGWVTEIPVYHSGEYVFVARFTTEAEPTDGDKRYITDHIYIQSDRAYQLLEEGNRILSPLNNWDRTIRSVNHRGYSVAAPENTLPAFRLSKENGFGFIETDIFFTADNKIVCIHDDTVDRTSDGSGNVEDMTLAQLKALDFGSWFSPTYAGTKIPTLEETLSLCHDLGIGCYIELKTTLSAEQAEQVYNTVKSCGMVGNVVYVSFAMQPLRAVAALDLYGRFGWLGSITQENIDNMLSLLNGTNKVFMDGNDTSSEAVALCVSNDIEQEYWVTEQEQIVEGLPKSIVGVTSNHLVAGRILYLNSR